MKMNLSVRKDNGFSSLSACNLLLVFIFSLISFIILVFFIPKGKKIELSSILPNIPIESAPVPKFIEHHQSGDWIFATGQTNGATVIYYPNTLEILSVRIIPTPVVQRSVSGLTIYEIAVRIQDYEGTRKMEVFQTTTPLVDRNPLFISSSPETMRELRKKIQPPLPE